MALITQPITVAILVVDVAAPLSVEAEAGMVLSVEISSWLLFHCTMSRRLLVIPAPFADTVMSEAELLVVTVMSVYVHCLFCFCFSF